MTLKNNKALLLFIFVVIAIGGFIFGRSVFNSPKENKQTITPIDASSTRDQDIRAETAPVPPEDNIDYHSLDDISFKAGYPNVGPLITTVNASLDPENQTIQFKKDTPQSHNIAKNNKVILLNKDGSIHLRDVEIGFIGETNAEGLITAGLSFDGALEKEELGNIATIITKETFAVKRLPLSAVQKDESGETYVWHITPIDENKSPTIFASADKLLLNKTYVNTALNDYRFFEAPISIRTTDLVLLNPNDALKENTVIPTVSINNINAPQGTMLFEARMKAAIENAEADILASIEQAEQCVANAEAMINAIPIPDEGDITGKQSTRSQANELPQAADAGACGAPSAGSCGGGSAGSCGGGDSAGSCGSDSAGSCGGDQPSACGADPYLSDFNSAPPVQIIDPYILLGIEPLAAQ